MSPDMNFDNLTIGGFPRVSGDEPVSRWGSQRWNGFSPRERG